MGILNTAHYLQDDSTDIRAAIEYYLDYNSNFSSACISAEQIETSHPKLPIAANLSGSEFIQCCFI
jgi:hypothetical protein